jgi:hypothetical protein
MEERVGERRIVFGSGPSPQSSPHSFLAGRGRKLDSLFLSKMRDLSTQWCGAA